MKDMAALLGKVVLSIVGGALLKNLSTLNIHVLHAMPGRIRLQCHVWKSEAIAERLADSIRTHYLVGQVSVSPVTGSLLVHFTQKHLGRRQFDKFMDLLMKQTRAGMEQETASATLLMSRTINRLDSRVKIATKGTLDLPSLFVIALTSQAVRGFSGNRGNSLQQLCWVYRLLRGGRQLI